MLLKSVGWGVVVYAVMYLVWSGLMMYGIEGLSGVVIRLAVLLLVTRIAAHSLAATSWTGILPYSLSWAATAVLLDGIFLVPFTGYALYASWDVWLGYALLLVLPLLAPPVKKQA
jgi:uncharacterized membrane protein SirB2